MTDSEKGVVTALSTISDGVIVSVVGLVLLKFFIEPHHDVRKVVGETRCNPVFAPTIHTPSLRSN